MYIVYNCILFFQLCASIIFSFISGWIILYLLQYLTQLTRNNGFSFGFNSHGQYLNLLRRLVLLHLIKKLLVSFRDNKLSLSSTFIKEQISIEKLSEFWNCEGAIFYDMNYDLRGHWRSHKATILYRNTLFLKIRILCFY